MARSPLIALFERIADDEVPALVQHLQQSRRVGTRVGGALLLFFIGMLVLSGLLTGGVDNTRMAIFVGGVLVASGLLNLAVRRLQGGAFAAAHELHVTLLTSFAACYGWTAPDMAWSHIHGMAFLIPFGVLIFSPLPPLFFLRQGLLAVAWELIWIAWLAPGDLGGSPFTTLTSGLGTTLACMGATQVLRRSWREQERARRQLQAADRLSTLGQHTAGIAHELKTPLAHALNEHSALGDLLDELGQSVHHPEVNPEDLLEIQREMLAHHQRLRDSLQRTAGFVQAIHAHTQQIHDQRQARFQLSQALQSARALLQHRLVTARVALITADVPDDLWLEGDPGKLEQVLLNLISNGIDAIQESAQGATITVRARAAARRVLVEVEDDGPGVPAHLREKIFEPLFTTRARRQGTGLGLAICRDLVQGVFDGTLSLRDSASGACFALDLPAASPLPLAPPRERAYTPFASPSAA